MTVDVIRPIPPASFFATRLGALAGQQARIVITTIQGFPSVLEKKTAVFVRRLNAAVEISGAERDEYVAARWA